MKMVFYSPRFYPLLGGLERVVEQWATALSQMDETVEVITTTPNAQADDFCFPVHRNPGWRRQWQLMRQADVVVQFNVSLKVLPLCLLSGRRLVISHHTLLYNAAGKYSLPQHLKHWVCNHLPVLNICCSRFVARQFLASNVVHSPYDASVFFNQNLERSPYHIMFVGRLVSDKGCDLLLQAMPSLQAKAPQCHLTVVGTGPEESRLQALAHQLGIANRVSFRGTIKGPVLATALNKHEVLVVPSRVEPFGITALEGLACGCQVLTSNAGGLPEAGGGFAQVFENGSVTDLVFQLSRLLDAPNLPYADNTQHLQQYTINATAALLLQNMKEFAT